MGFKRRVVRIEALLHISPFVLGILRVGEIGSFVVIQGLKSSGYRERQFRALGRCCGKMGAWLLHVDCVAGLGCLIWLPQSQVVTVGKKQSIPINSCQSIGQSSDEGGDPLGPTKEIGALMSLKVEVDLLKDVLGLEGDHARGPGERH